MRLKQMAEIQLMCDEDNENKIVNALESCGFTMIYDTYDESIVNIYVEKESEKND